jgi:hypothetical protein
MFNNMLYGAIAVLIIILSILWVLYSSANSRISALKNQVAQYEISLQNKEKEILFLKEFDKKQLDLIFQNEKEIEQLKLENDKITEELLKIPDNESSEVLKQLMRSLGNQK